MRAKIQLRNQLYQTIREFFHTRDVLEVETPLLSHYGVTDLHIQNIEAVFHHGNQAERAFLQSSPEYAMKRLLAANSGDIFQITKAFRDGECGNKHNPEFSLLEWYRVGFTHFELMHEVSLLLQCIFNTAAAELISYQQLFQTYLHVDPLTTDKKTLFLLLQQHQIIVDYQPLSHTDCLDLLLTHVIEPYLGQDKPVIIYHYPKEQAALAKINGAVAERFEAYYKGIELANGFHELTDAKEQLKRFEQDNQQRQAQNLAIKPIDSRLIDALKTGLPACAGVAIGIDRLLMLQANTKSIKDVMCFDWPNA